MTKKYHKQLSEALCQKYPEMPKSRAQEIVGVVVAEMRQSLMDGETVRLRGVGDLYLTEVGPRRMQSNLNGRIYDIPPTVRVRFRASKDLIRSMNRRYQ